MSGTWCILTDSPDVGSLIFATTSPGGEPQTCSQQMVGKNLLSEKMVNFLKILGVVTRLFSAQYLQSSGRAEAAL